MDDDIYQSAIPMPFNKPDDSPMANVDRSHRIGLLLDYVKKEGPGWVPGLPSSLRDPAGWALHGLENLRDELGFGISDSCSPSAIASVFQPVSSLMQPPSAEEAEAMWLTPDYHHKGFLPIHDAMIMGVNLRHSMLRDHMQIDARPFYGQNWHGLDNYWGTEASFHLRSANGKKPWGTITLRYINGEQNLMDHGRGFDMHSELNFDKHLSLNAGVRGNDDANLGNYVMLRWTLANLGQ